VARSSVAAILQPFWRQAPATKTDIGKLAIAELLKFTQSRIKVTGKRDRLPS